LSFEAGDVVSPLLLLATLPLLIVGVLGGDAGTTRSIQASPTT
jgi:hypothetical protein